jgi:hypothetical protein
MHPLSDGDHELDFIERVRGAVAWYFEAHVETR